jgi:predicted metal-dependent hydrolase
MLPQRVLRWHAAEGSRARHLQLQAHREGGGGRDGRVLHLLMVLVLLLHCCSLCML